MGRDVMLKGKTEIILTDVKTKKKEIIKEENLVTDALDKLSKINILGDCPIKKMIPLKKSLQGLLVLDENIEEDTNNFILPYNCRVIAHAGNTASSSDIKGGSFNEAESENLTNGYKFVWDFATHQANGTIKCLSLTSAIGGTSGFGGTYEQKSAYDYYYSKAFVDTKFREYGINQRCHIVSNNRLYAISGSETIFAITEYFIPMTELDIISNPAIAKPLKTYNIEIDEPYESNNYSNTNDYLYIFTVSKNLIAKVYEVAINDFTIKRSISLDTWSSQYLKNKYFRGIVNGDYIYVYGFYTSENQDGRLYKINLSNPNDIKVIKDKNNNRASLFGANSYSFFNNRIYDGKLVLENDEFNYFGKDYSNVDYTYIGSLFYDLVSVYTASSFVDTNGFNYFYLSYNPLYLATINNLANPIVKTADKTMKVIYTITGS